LPDVAAIESRVKGVADIFWLRGVEVVAVGRVLNERGVLRLKLEQTAESVLLAPLVRKIQWSFREQQAHPLRETERTAHERLKAALSRHSARVRIVGPLVGRTIEVREFTLLGNTDSMRTSTRFWLMCWLGLCSCHSPRQHYRREYKRYGEPVIHTAPPMNRSRVKHECQFTLSFPAPCREGLVNLPFGLERPSFRFNQLTQSPPRAPAQGICGFS
jgi:hypothetical protein